MATKNIVLCGTINESGLAQNPTAGVQMMLTKPDGTTHTDWGAASAMSNVGTGAYKRTFTIDDSSDESGVYCLFIKTTTDGAKTPIGSSHITITVS